MAVAEVVIDSKTKALDRTYTYAIPKDLSAKVGQAVLVDYNSREYVAFIVGIDKEKSEDDFDFSLNAIKEIISEPYFDEKTAELLIWIAHKYVAPLPTALRLACPIGGTPRIVTHKDGTSELKKPPNRSKKITFCADEVALRAGSYCRPESLTHEQKKALKSLEVARNRAKGECVLIDGVTGSGKTEVYLQIIEEVLESGQNAIVLVPEIALTPQTVARFVSRFGDKIAVLHSKMTQAQRRHQWFWIKQGNARIVIGARSALFAPLKDVGIVIIDEEHETSYKQESAPRYHARDVAKRMMEINGGLLVLGSATPSIESLYLAKHDNAWERVELTTRATGSRMPKVEVVDMTNLPHGGKYSIFSTRLKNLMVEELKANHKVVLLLNQRGFSKFLLCRDCGFVPECPNCSTSLTFHESGNMLKCHHCGYVVASPPTCPNCGSHHIKRLGTGTQKVEGELKLLLSKESSVVDAKVIRMDADSTSTSNSHEKLLDEFASANRAVLLGTQMIAKGLDFEDVTLVGVINADTTMHVPDFRASERTYSLIEQVSGRCGRARLPGTVVVQTYEPDNCALRAAQSHDRELFLRVELPKRKVLKFPPYVSITRVLVWSSVKDLAQSTAEALREKLEIELSQEIKEGLQISPVSACPFEKLQKSWRFHIIIKAPLEQDTSKKIEAVFRKFHAGKLVSTAVDVDPISLV